MKEFEVRRDVVRTAARRALRAPDALARRARADAAADRGAGAILYYHRVAAPAQDPWALAVAAETFDRQLAMLGARYEVLPVAELAAAARAGRMPSRAVAISFDDGYADNLERALPLLERHRMPASVYVATGYVGADRPYWWDELEVLLTGPGPRPPQLHAELGDARISAPTATAAERERALTDVAHPVLRQGPPDRIAAWLEIVRAWAGEGAAAAAADRGRPMGAAELEELAASELIEIGAHTVAHASLASLSRAWQRREIEGSWRYVTELLGRPPRGFSYPFGDNTAYSRSVVRACGFDYAVGVREDGPLTPVARRFELPRLMPVEEPAEALAERIDALLDGAPLP